jgi:hypothetical protein
LVPKMSHFFLDGVDELVDFGVQCAVNRSVVVDNHSVTVDNSGVNLTSKAKSQYERELSEVGNKIVVRARCNSAIVSALLASIATRHTKQ